MFNPLYDVSVRVLHRIFAPYGRIVRLVVFRKTSVQALIEFDTVEAAVATQRALDGQDIYSDCCTLKVLTGLSSWSYHGRRAWHCFRSTLVGSSGFRSW